MGIGSDSYFKQLILDVKSHIINRDYLVKLS